MSTRFFEPFGFALRLIDMPFIGAVFDFSQCPIPIRRIARKLLYDRSELKLDGRVFYLELFQIAHDAHDFHAHHRWRDFFDADKILLISHA